uniref:VWF/SSPO/Zonadhesin-like cysteine-rich domain-containing protein n=1 Tax=Periophthalmus magnuspinnatus TaxID=409849 RepID=A0A3B3ZA78_9GOBI
MSIYINSLWLKLMVFIRDSTQKLSVIHKTARFYPDSCRSFGSGAVQPFNGTLFHVRSDCTCTLTSFTHNRVDCTITTRRGRNGLQEHVEILINRIRTVLHNGSIQVEETKNVPLPFDHMYQHIFPFGIYTKLRSSVIPLSVVWHSVPGGIDTLWIEIEQELDTDMEGLCGTHLRSITSETHFGFSEFRLSLIFSLFTHFVLFSQGCREFLSFTLDCLTHMTSDYINVCEENMYNYEQNEFIRCSFFQEVVRQCKHMGHIGDKWRRITQCREPTCPGDLLYVEEGAAFIPSCLNPKIDSYELTSSCVCPAGESIYVILKSSLRNIAT